MKRPNTIDCPNCTSDAYLIKKGSDVPALLVCISCGDFSLVDPDGSIRSDVSTPGVAKAFLGLDFSLTFGEAEEILEEEVARYKNQTICPGCKRDTLRASLLSGQRTPIYRCSLCGYDSRDKNRNQQNNYVLCPMCGARQTKRSELGNGTVMYACKPCGVFTEKQLFSQRTAMLKMDDAPEDSCSEWTLRLKRMAQDEIE